MKQIKENTMNESKYDKQKNAIHQIKENIMNEKCNELKIIGHKMTTSVYRKHTHRI